ncbi:Integral membrane protein [hydrothermal vent metagenome]|uniref:Integral membrane protein n=1 Tax=hydrothermal vent metagenome TaxID=652676 RepID=A0A3B0TFX5_9ZZZZ
MSDPLFVLVAVVAVFIVALAKSGLLGSLGMIGVPLLSLVMPAREAAGILLPVLIIMDVVGLLAYRGQFDRKILKLMLPGALLGIAIGWALFSLVSDDGVLLLVGLLTLAFVFDAVMGQRIRFKPTLIALGAPGPFWGRFWGAVAGFTSFISHTGGPPFQIYVLPKKLAPAIYAGTSVWFFAIVNMLKLVAYFFLAQLSPASLEISAALAPVAIIGMLAGVWLVRRISAKLFYNLAYWLVFLLAIKLIYDGAKGLFGL